VRIHVERVIGVLKQKYTILQGTLPIAKDDNDNTSTIDAVTTPSASATGFHANYFPITSGSIP